MKTKHFNQTHNCFPDFIIFLPIWLINYIIIFICPKDDIGEFSIMIQFSEDRFFNCQLHPGQRCMTSLNEKGGWWDFVIENNCHCLPTIRLRFTAGLIPKPPIHLLYYYKHVSFQIIFFNASRNNRKAMPISVINVFVSETFCSFDWLRW